MKKINAIIAALVLAVSSAAAFSASAEDNIDDELPEDYFTYKPYCYFKACEGENIFILPKGSAYVNTYDIPDEGVVVDTETYYVDKYKLTGQMVMKLAYDTGDIVPQNAYFSTEKYGTEVFEDVGEIHVFSNPEHYPYTYVSYMLSNIGLSPSKYSVENSDDVALFTVGSYVSKDTQPGDYTFYIHEAIPRGIGTSGVVRYDLKYRDLIPGGIAGSRGYKIYPESGDIHIRVSDREFGDFNDSCDVTAFDAELMLDCYAESAGDNNTEKYTVGSHIAGDVNEDGIVDADDAELVLDYALSTKDKTRPESFYEYLCSISAQEQETEQTGK